MKVRSSKARGSITSVTFKGGRSRKKESRIWGVYHDPPGVCQPPVPLRTRARKKRRIRKGAQRNEAQGVWNPHKRGKRRQLASVLPCTEPWARGTQGPRAQETPHPPPRSTRFPSVNTPTQATPQTPWDGASSPRLAPGCTCVHPRGNALHAIKHRARARFLCAVARPGPPNPTPRQAQRPRRTGR